MINTIPFYAYDSKSSHNLNNKYRISTPLVTICSFGNINSGGSGECNDSSMGGYSALTLVDKISILCVLHVELMIGHFTKLHACVTYIMD